jgi:hypothetical protein
MRLKIIISAAFCLFLLKELHSQVSKLNTWNLSAGLDAVFPETSFRKTHSQGFGATLKAEFRFQEHTSLTFSSGLYRFPGKTYVENPNARNAFGVPVKAGLRYYLGKFYIGGEGGWIKQSGYKANNGFVYAFSIGDEIITSKRSTNSLDISLRNEVWVTDRSRAFAGLRLAYEFRLR